MRIPVKSDSHSGGNWTAVLGGKRGTSPILRNFYQLIIIVCKQFLYFKKEYWKKYRNNWGMFVYYSYYE